MPYAVCLRLFLLDCRLAVCRLGPLDEVPEWAGGGAFSSATRTSTELSIVCAEGAVPDGIHREGGWRIFQVEGPLDFALTGVLASIAQPLAEAGVSLFAVSTFDTDYVMVRERDVEAAVLALRAAGHRVG
ncbi:MAG: ACT domain-containing protein [Bryobacteraceae bacterium]|jgi:hypothetical protein